MRSDFAIFIMSYKRSSCVYTVDTLNRSGYTGKYYIIVGDDDPELDSYIERYRDRVVVFNKETQGRSFDICDGGGSEKVIVYARNFCFSLANRLGIKYFLQFDDDYVSLEYRYEQEGKLKTRPVNEFDEVCNIFVEYLESTNIDILCFAQNGDFIGGKDAWLFRHKVKRKAMNSFFCKTNSPVEFIGRINEDVNTYVHFGKTGTVFLTVADVSLRQKETQKNVGGMTETYDQKGTYLKSFYTVMVEPSCSCVRAMDTRHTRIHHRIDWNSAVPKIISDSYKKQDLLLA